MAKTDVVTSLIAALEPAAELNGFELVTVEQTGGRHTPVIRVLLDRPGGVTLDDICSANQWVTDIVDEASPFGGPYTLEVSSPGVDRPLRKTADYERFSGQTVTIKTAAKHGERSAWTGTLLGVEGDSVRIDVDGETVSLPLAEIVKARLKGVVSFDREKDGSK